VSFKFNYCDSSVTPLNTTHLLLSQFRNASQKSFVAFADSKNILIYDLITSSLVDKIPLECFDDPPVIYFLNEQELLCGSSKAVNIYERTQAKVTKSKETGFYTNSFRTCDNKVLLHGDSRMAIWDIDEDTLVLAQEIPMLFEATFWGDKVISTHMQGKIRIWNKNLQELQILNSLTNSIYSIDIWDANSLIINIADKVGIISAENGDAIKTFTIPSASTSDILFLRKCMNTIACVRSDELVVFDVNTSQVIFATEWNTNGANVYRPLSHIGSKIIYFDGSDVVTFDIKRQQTSRIVNPNTNRRVELCVWSKFISF
jgi:hypothetical protein